MKEELTSLWNNKKFQRFRTVYVEITKYVIMTISTLSILGLIGYGLFCITPWILVVYGLMLMIAFVTFIIVV